MEGVARLAKAWMLGLAVVALTALAGGAPPVSADEGVATWYGEPYHGRRMANGQLFDMNDPATAASNRFPLGTWLRVTNLANGRSVTVQVRDRGAFSHALDLSYGAFAAIADPDQMTVRVRYVVVAGPDAAPEPEAAPAAAPPPAPAPAAAPPPARPSAAEHVVEPGDTLGGIAQRYGLSVADLVRYNGLADPDHVVVGQVLSLRAPTAAVKGASYVVQPGDVLWEIAARFGVAAADVAATNGIGAEGLIHPGQVLKVPLPGRWYTVQPGDTLGAIAARHGTTTAALLALNSLADPDLIRPGDELRVE